MQSQQPPLVVSRVIVYAIWSVTPLAWAYVLAACAVRAWGSRTLRDVLLHTVRGTLPSGKLEYLPRLRRLLRSRILFAYAALEVLFSLAYRYRAKHIQAPVRIHRPSRQAIVNLINHVVNDGMADHGRHEELAALEHFTPAPLPTDVPHVRKPLDPSDPRAREFSKSLSSWFIGLSPEHITRDNVREWLAWAMFGQWYHELDGDVKRHKGRVHGSHPLFFVDRTVKLFEARRGHPYPQKVELTPAEKVRHHMMLVTLDPVRVSQRPLASYLLQITLSIAVRSYLGVRFRVRELRCERIWYLLYEPPDWDIEDAIHGEAPLPVLFLHGLGFGVPQYVCAIRALLGGPQGLRRPILVPELPWMSHEFFSPEYLYPWQAPEAAETIQTIVRLHGFERCGISVISHSMGTITHSFLIKRCTSIVRRSALVDPVCFQLWVPEVCYRFLYKRADSFVELMLRYFVARELGIANTITRHFEWSSNVLLPNELPNANDPQRTRIYLAGSDTVLDAPGVQKYLARNGIVDTVTYVPGEHHGGTVMVPNRHLDDMVAWLDRPLGMEGDALASLETSSTEAN